MRSGNADPSTVATKFGNVYGKIETFDGEDVMAFSGIRYAKPPVDDLRFTKPEPVDDETIEQFGLQSSERVACIQPQAFLKAFALNSSEDCLHLNVWVPIAKDDDPKLLPVMIFIHGGSFHILSGNIDSFRGVVLSALGRVIVVTLNYRLGFFGFLNAGVPSAGGNMGLYDQAAALTWVKENIQSFGGDPDAITVFGQSAGGLSVGLLTVSPITRNLFNRAIIESGSPYSPLRPESASEVLKKSLVLSKAVDCSLQTDKIFTISAIECLRSIDPQVINEYGKDMVLHSQILPNPMFGGAFIPTNVHELMKNPENVNPKLEVLIGIVRDEGLIFTYEQLRSEFFLPDNTTVTKDEVQSMVTKLLNGRSVDPVQATNYYFRNMTEAWDVKDALDILFELYGDLYINCPSYFLAKRFSEILGFNRTHTYLVSDASSQSVLPFCKALSKVCHGDELSLVFGVPLRMPQSFDASDLPYSKQFVQRWTEFARTGLVFHKMRKISASDVARTQLVYVARVCMYVRYVYKTPESLADIFLSVSFIEVFINSLNLLRKVNWTNTANDLFMDISKGAVHNFHTYKREACDAFWWQIFQDQF